MSGHELRHVACYIGTDYSINSSPFVQLLEQVTTGYFGSPQCANTTLTSRTKTTAYRGAGVTRGWMRWIAVETQIEKINPGIRVVSIGTRHGIEHWSQGIRKGLEVQHIESSLVSTSSRRLSTRLHAA